MGRINDEFYSDIYITPDKQVFVPDTRTENGLRQIHPDDFDALDKCLSVVAKKWNSLSFQESMKHCFGTVPHMHHCLTSSSRNSRLHILWDLSNVVPALLG